MLDHKGDRASSLFAQSLLKQQLPYSKSKYPDAAIL